MIKHVEVTFVVEADKATDFLENCMAMLEKVQAPGVTITKPTPPIQPPEAPKAFGNRRLNPKPAVSPVEAPKILPTGDPTLDPPIFCTAAGEWQEVKWEETISFGKPGSKWLGKTWRELPREDVFWLADKLDDKTDRFMMTGLTSDNKGRIKAVRNAYLEEDRRPRDKMPEDTVPAS